METRHLILGAGVSGNAAAELLKAEGAGFSIAPKTEGGAAVERFFNAEAEVFNAEAQRRGGAENAEGARGRVETLPQARETRVDENRLQSDPGETTPITHASLHSLFPIPYSPFPIPQSLTVVVSPGIAPDDAEVARARELGMNVVGEMQLGVSRFKGRVIAVTGSKGKSSLVKLISDTLNLAAGRGVAVPCGNYGAAMCAVAAMEPQPEIAALECSSFQLEYGAMERGPDAALVLNISPDHLDRHKTMEAYCEAKLNIFENMRPGALRLLPSGEELLRGRFRARFGGEPAPLSAESLRFAEALAGTYFGNEILRPAARAAYEILRFLGLSEAEVAAGFRAFEPLPHRMQKVAECRGVAFVDDSKATSLAAMAAAVKMSAKPVFLIAGGRLKERVETNGRDLIESGVRKAYLIGECAEEMRGAWRGSFPTEISGEMKAAVEAAFADALEAGGGTVLLSPGTASFDQFKNYKQRGEAFAEAAIYSAQNARTTTTEQQL